jgi:hypothetical protein
LPVKTAIGASGRPRTFHGHVQDNKQKFLLSTSLTVNQRQCNHVMKTIGVDVGGTFTDLVYCELEHKGARCGMITNEGFRDILHIARHQRCRSG